MGESISRSPENRPAIVPPLTGKNTSLRNAQFALRIAVFLRERKRQPEKRRIAAGSSVLCGETARCRGKPRFAAGAGGLPGNPADSAAASRRRREPGFLCGKKACFPGICRRLRKTREILLQRGDFSGNARDFPAMRQLPGERGSFSCNAPISWAWRSRSGVLAPGPPAAESRLTAQKIVQGSCRVRASLCKFFPGSVSFPGHSLCNRLGSGHEDASEIHPEPQRPRRRRPWKWNPCVSCSCTN